MRARRRMLWNGVVTGTLVLNREGGLCAVPAVSQTGISNEADAADYIAAASLAIEDALAAMGRSARRDDGQGRGNCRTGAAPGGAFDVRAPADYPYPHHAS